jgi:Carboxypeptidase regulatory-like domain
MRFSLVFLFWLAAIGVPLFAQSPNGNINGLVSDQTNAAVPGAEIIAVNDATGVQYTTKTNMEGIYVLANLPPGQYRVQVSKIGFKTLIKPDIILNVQDALSVNFNLLVGALHEIVTVQGGSPLVNTESAAVSTVVDRQFAENLPMNGRSFQTLIELTPGVVLTASTAYDSGQFSVNGQRAASNYWMVDGVSANIGIGASQFSPGNGVGGTVGSFSALGGTNSLVSVDAMQEFRIQTSTFAPEFGRTPGAEISIVTRSGTNQFHGTVFEYLRNDAFDANNWFNGYTNNPPLPKARERQNDFGGTFSGPIFRDQTFFFFSYEGLRLRLPQTTLTTVPDLLARSSAVPSMQPYLSAYPLPNGPDDPATGIAQCNQTYSNPAILDAYSLRVDHKLHGNWTIFGRYNYSPSEYDARGNLSLGLAALSTVDPIRITTQTLTAGVTETVSSNAANDLRLNYSRVDAIGNYRMDNFGGATPLTAPPFPAPFTTGDARFYMAINDLSNPYLFVGQGIQNEQRQFNLVDGFSWQKRSHGLKLGVDFRELAPVVSPDLYRQFVSFDTVQSAEGGNSSSGTLDAFNQVSLRFHNLGVYAQDTWRVSPRLTITYGARWDVDFAPSSASGPSLVAVTGYSLTDLSSLAVAPAGTAPFRTPYSNLAPRIGGAYQISRSSNWRTVTRAGFGVFYDLVSSETGNALGGAFPPFGNFSRLSNQIFPFTSSQIEPPPIPSAGNISRLFAFNPNLQLPYTLEWNGSVEQMLGKQQIVSATYIGASGRRLLQSTQFFFPPSNPNIVLANFVDNTAVSDYQALQVKFQRRLAQGLQALASYTWSHSIDTASAGSLGNSSNANIVTDTNQNRGSSDFDIRNAFTAGVTYELPSLGTKRFTHAILSGWSTESFILARSAPPVDLSDVNFSELNGGVTTNIRPDVVTGQPFYLYGPQYPGGKAFNPSAFTNPPSDASTGNPIRQGDLGRNVLRGFGAAQWDFAVHRDFPLTESTRLQFRMESFNVLNHPNFASPNNSFGEGGFGLSSQMLGQSLASGNIGGGGLSPLYQIGGPRSLQFALKLIF